MLLPYENPKWERLRKDILQIGYHFEDTPRMDGYVKRLRKSAMQKEDYAHYFASLSLSYHSWVRDRYLMNPNDSMLADDTYRSGVAGVISQQLGGLDLPQWENEFATALYELVALDRTDAEYFTNKKSVLSCILLNDFELAEQMLSTIEADHELRIGAQYIDLKYLKNLYLAIIHGDEAAFNDEIVRRIRAYRKNPYTHSVVIDFPLVALIKIANRNGIAYLGYAAEIPQAMLTQQFTTSAKCTKPPLMEEAAEMFGVYCG